MTKRAKISRQKRRRVCASHRARPKANLDVLWGLADPLFRLHLSAKGGKRGTNQLGHFAAEI